MKHQTIDLIESIREATVSKPSGTASSSNPPPPENRHGRIHFLRNNPRAMADSQLHGP
jgi:hypothetical protein